MRIYFAALVAAFLIVSIAPTVAQGQRPPVGMPITFSARAATALTPNDSTNFTPTRAIYLAGGAACNISVVFADDADDAPVTLTSITPGWSHPFSIKRLMSTGTTCTGVIALR